MRKNLKKEKGITLIALVITIIVLLILAGISIATLTGQNGILTQANRADLETRGGTVDERVGLWKTEKKSSEYTMDIVKTEEEMLQELLNEKLVFEEEINRENKTITIGNREISYALEGKTEMPNLNGLLKILNTKVYENERAFLKSDSIGITEEEAQNCFLTSMLYLFEKYNISEEDEEGDPSGTIRLSMIYLNERKGKNFKTVNECKQYLESLSEEEQQTIFEEAYGMLTGNLFYMYINGEKVNKNMNMKNGILSFKIAEIENLKEDANITFELNLSSEIKSEPIYIERYAISPRLWEDQNENLLDGFYIYDRYENTKITDAENVNVNIDNSGWNDITEYYKNTEDGVMQISDFVDLGINVKVEEEGKIKVKFTKNSKEYLYEGNYYIGVR